MTALAPAWLALLALVGVVAVLHLVRPRPRALRTSTLPFFLGLDRRQAENPWLRRLKRLLALLLSALVVVCATAAAARVVLGGDAGVRGVVVLVDTSASLAAGGRLAQLRAQVAARLAALPADVPVTLLAYDARPRLVVARTSERQALRGALAELAVRPVAGDPAPALALARRLAAADAPAAVWHATDAPAPPEEAEGVRVETLCPPAAALVNAGITAAGLRPLPQERNRHAVFVQVEGTAPGPLTAELEVALDGRPIEVRRLELAPGRAERLSIPLESKDGSRLRLSLKAPDDALAADDVVDLPIPPPRTLRLVHVAPRPDPFVALALAACAGEGDVELRSAAPAGWTHAAGDDLVVFDGWTPTELPPAACLLIDPPAGAPGLPLRRLDGDGLPVEAPRVLDGDHALLVGIANRRVALTQTGAIDTDAGLEPLWASDAGVLLAAARRGGHRAVVMAFAPGRSERLPLSAAFPLLMANAIAWATAGDGAAVPVLRTGSLVDARGGLAWDGAVPADGPVRPCELDRGGVWRDAGGRNGAAALLARAETVLPAGDPEAANPGALAAFDGDLVTAALWLLFAVLLLESWLFHRRGVS